MLLNLKAVEDQGDTQTCGGGKKKKIQALLSNIKSLGMVFDSRFIC